MLFCSEKYLIFFLIVFAVYWACPFARFRVWFLLGASFYFYASWNKWLATIICVSCLMDYLIARWLDASANERWRRALLILSLTANLGLLIYFKYANFFLQSAEEALRAAGASASMPVLQVVLPIGISFYTFEAISYTIDVYRRRIKAETNLAHFMLFITFFPHLVAGPIVRPRDFLPQIRRPKRWNWLRLQVGLQIFLIGLFKKMVVADRMAQYADPVFADPATYSTLAIWLGVLAYALQIYCDFSGYSDMALGSAHMLGYHLALNFNMPYLARNVAEFWHRWHISLSTWLRDYLFIPLGGSRGTTWQTCRNLLITMILGGLWHGASWTFIVWGLLHGLFLIGHRFFQAFCKDKEGLQRILESLPGNVLRVAVTFLCICVGWVFFRSTTFETATTILLKMVTLYEGIEPPTPYQSLAVLSSVLILGWLAATLGVWRRGVLRIPAPAWGLCFAGLIILSLALAPEIGAAFIYFQF